MSLNLVLALRWGAAAVPASGVGMIFRLSGERYRAHRHLRKSRSGHYAHIFMIWGIISQDKKTVKNNFGGVESEIIIFFWKCIGGQKIKMWKSNQMRAYYTYVQSPAIATQHFFSFFSDGPWAARASSKKKCEEVLGSNCWGLYNVH